MGGFRRPACLEEALALLAAAPHRVIAGGTDVYPADVATTVWGGAGLTHPGAPPMLDVTAIPALSGVTSDDRGVRIGAAVTWRELIRAPLPPAFDGLKAAAREVGGRQIQNRGTLGGNLCNASPAADGVPPLLCLDAAVELVSWRGRRHLALQDFIRTNRSTALAGDELLVALHVPFPPATARSAFAKLGARRYLVISIAMVAAVVATDDRGLIGDARLAVGACSAVAQRLERLERRLVGVPPAAAPAAVTAADLSHLEPIDDVRASADYRRAAALELLRRVLAEPVPKALAA